VRIAPRTFDLLLAGGVLVASAVELALSDAVTGSRAVAIAIAAVMSALLVVRRRHPLPAALALLALGIAQSALVVDMSDLVASFFPLLILAYSGGAFADGNTARASLAVLLLAVLGVGLVDSSPVGDIFFPSVIVVLCWLGGRNVRTRTRLAAELHEAAARLAEQREAEAREAVADERRRIAREMHDVVAHGISIMVVQAAGARQILRSDAGRAEQAAGRIARAGRDALLEMQLLVGALEAVAGDGPAASLDALPALVERARDTGLAVTLAVTGTPRPVPQGAELAAYRVVQEALTNVIKHAAEAPAEVAVDWDDAALTLAVRDRGGTSAELAGAGQGLIGMGERVRLYGGELSAGPRAGGGFEVVARIPLAASVPEPVAP
jgi:signal transduction histidine kinase